MTFERFVNKLGRIIWLYLIVCGIIFSMILVWLEWDTFRAICWHVRHGSHIAFEGHTFHVPLLWNCDYENGNRDRTISESHPVFGGLSSVNLAATGKVLDAAAAYRWQNDLVKALNMHLKIPDTMTPEVIHGKRLEFVCVRDDIGGIGALTLFCRVPNTDLDVSVTATNNYEARARAILESSY